MGSPGPHAGPEVRPAFCVSSLVVAGHGGGYFRDDRFCCLSRIFCLRDRPAYDKVIRPCGYRGGRRCGSFLVGGGRSFRRIPGSQGSFCVPGSRVWHVLPRPIGSSRRCLLRRLARRGAPRDLGPQTHSRRRQGPYRRMRSRQSRREDQRRSGSGEFGPLMVCE
jgi:hypothetical protein